MGEADYLWAVEDFISLLDPDGAPMNFRDRLPIAALTLYFHDVDDRHEAFIQQGVVQPFTELMASTAASFVEILAPWITLLIVHCEVGVSRSAGMGLALAEHYEGDPSWYHRHKAPNQRVYRLMREVLK